MIFFYGFGKRVPGPVRRVGAEGAPEVADRCGQLRSVVLDRQTIVGAAILDQLGNLGLCADGIDGQAARPCGVVWRLASLEATASPGTSFLSQAPCHFRSTGFCCSRSRLDGDRTGTPAVDHPWPYANERRGKPDAASHSSISIHDGNLSIVRDHCNFALQGAHRRDSNAGRTASCGSQKLRSALKSAGYFDGGALK